MINRYYFVKAETLDNNNYSYRVFAFRSLFSQPVKAFLHCMKYYDGKYGKDQYLITDFKRV